MAASDPTTETGKVLKLSADAQTNVINFVKGVLALNKRDSGFRNKMDAIDIAYARYKEQKGDSLLENGIDNRGEVGCGNVFDDDDITPPIVVSQVDSYVAYLADVFLSGSPIFPVVSNPTNKKYAEQLETLLDDHALLGGYARQLLLFLRDAVKYNYAAVELDWTSIDQFSVAGDFTSGTGKKVSRKAASFTRVKRLNPRNILRDMTVDPGDIAEHGDYAGYVELISKMKLKTLLNKLNKEGKAYNEERAMGSLFNHSTAPMGNYTQNPIISNYVDQNMGAGGSINWESWFSPQQTSGKRVASYGNSYELTTLYARILPKDFGITAPQPKTPQIWKFRVINETWIISAQRIVSAYDYLPILFAQPLEDGMGYQTQSPAEGAIGFQEGASTLYNIRFAAARRAVSDRALYVSEMINSSDVNSKTPAPKIPVRLSVLSNKKLSDAYESIPFESRGLETVMQDAQTIVNFGQQLSGINKPREGQFQKGNKSVTEWNDTMAGSDNRLRLPALLLEHQFFSPMKSIIVLNIYQYAENAVVISQKTGEVVNIDIETLRKQVLAFRVADGYSPKSKLASTEAVAGLLQLISSSQILQQAYGASLPGMFAHLAQLQGVRGLEEYDPRFQPTQPAPTVPGLAPAVVPPIASTPLASVPDATVPLQTPAIP